MESPRAASRVVPPGNRARALTRERSPAVASPGARGSDAMASDGERNGAFARPLGSALSPGAGTGVWTQPRRRRLATRTLTDRTCGPAST
jgi:hypothetical protein